MVIIQELIIIMEIPNPYFALQNSYGHKKEFLRNYGQFGHASSRRFTSPALRSNSCHRIKAAQST
jgi:hypothetical protein